MKKYYLMTFLAGIFYAWGFPVKNFFNFFLFPVIGFSFYYYTVKLKFISLKQLLLLTLMFDFGYFLLGYYWIITLLENFGSIHAPWNYLLGVTSCLILTPHYFIFVIIYKFIVKHLNKSLLPLILSLILVLLENYIPQEFPAHIGHPWLQITPYLGLAPIFGSSIYSFISYLIAISIVEHLTTKIRPSLSYSIIIILLISNFSIKLPVKALKSKKLNIRVVQANIENNLKLQSEKNSFGAAAKVENIYLKLSTDNAEKLDMIIWPETAYHRLLTSKLMYKEKLNTPKVIKDVILKTKAFLLTGGYDQKIESDNFFETIYNSAFYFTPDSLLNSVYHKQVLIPFGETLPLGPFNSFFKNLNSNISFFAKGKTSSFLKIKDATFSMAICYEILYPSFLRQYFKTKKPDFIINITNDSWYGDTSEPFQHLFLARWRALEWQIPIIRSTNTGITALIHSDGSYTQLIPQNSSDYKDFTINY